MRTCTNSKSIRTYRCVDLRASSADADGPDDRQKRVPGFSQAALDDLSVGVIGGGGLGSWFTFGAAKKGVGRIVIYDGDKAETSNLNRQLLTPRDIGRNKALAVARNTARSAYLGSRIAAVPHFFQAAVERGLVQDCDVVFCGVDNDETRVFVSRYYLGTPVVFAAVSRDASYGYVAVQEPDGPCFGCFRPPALEARTAVTRDDGACPVDPAVIDIVGLIAMVALYAVDSLVMERPRHWNFKLIALHGAFPEVSAHLPKRDGCPLCSGL